MRPFSAARGGLPACRSQPTLASELRSRGWATGIIGKWHLGAEASYGPLHRGFDTHFGFRAGCVDYYSHIYYWGQEHPLHDLWEDENEVWLNGEYLTDVIARRASEYIERHADDRFFLYVPFNAPHYPMHAPEKYVQRFAHLPEDRRMMAAMIAAMDDGVGDGVGEILATLERLGLRDDTILGMVRRPVLRLLPHRPSQRTRARREPRDARWLVLVPRLLLQPLPQLRTVVEQAGLLDG